MEKIDIINNMFNNLKNNIAVVGLPRSGKTYYTKKLFEDFTEEGLSIYINTQWESYFTGYKIIKTLEEFSIDDTKVVINFEENEMLIPLINKLFAIQKQSVIPKPIRIIVDEIYQFQAFDNAKHTLTKLVVDGLKWGIQCAATAHYPSMVHSSIYKNIHLWVFFRMNPQLYDFFKRTWKIDLFKHQNYLAEENKWNYVIYDGGGNFYTKDELYPSDLKKPKAKEVTITEILKQYGGRR